MVRYENKKLVVEIQLTNGDEPKIERNAILKSLLYVIGNMDDNLLSMVGTKELYYITMLAGALVSEEGDDDDGMGYRV